MIPPLTSPGSSALRWRILSGQHPAPKCRTLFRLHGELEQLFGDSVDGGVRYALKRVQEARLRGTARAAPVEVLRHRAYETPRGFVESDLFLVLVPQVQDGVEHLILLLGPRGHVLRED